MPKGPTLDPGVRRIAVHVEDHPIEYLDFEGVIPAGEYGGGDVIVWDIGTWEPHETDDPAAAVAAGELHVDVYGREAARPVRPGPQRGRQPRRARTQWLLLHKHDEYAVDGWDPEDHPRSVLSGRTNDEVKADPRPAVALRPAAGAGVVRSRCGHAGRRWPAARARTSWPRSTRCGHERDLGGVRPRLRLTNLDKVLFPGRDGEEPVTKRDLIRYAARIAPVILPYLARPGAEPAPVPRRRAGQGFWHKQLPEHAPDWLPRWDNPDADRGETHDLPGRRRARRAGLGGQLRRARVARLDSRTRPSRSSRRTR